MYLATLHGKLPSEIASLEDLVTSNVFGFLKYADRQRYLGSVLNLLDVDASAEDLESAELTPWPTYAANTEPDVVLRVAMFYILFEAKWLSPFGKESEKTDAQVDRELREGSAQADSENLVFRFVPVTPDFHYENEVAKKIPTENRHTLRWLRWGDIASVVQEVLRDPNAPDRRMAEDLIAVMRRQHLLLFQGFRGIDSRPISSPSIPLFLQDSSYRFSGFKGLTALQTIASFPGRLRGRST